MSKRLGTGIQLQLNSRADCAVEITILLTYITHIYKLTEKQYESFDQVLLIARSNGEQFGLLNA